MDGGERFEIYKDPNGLVYPEPYPTKEILERVYSGVKYHVVRQVEVGHVPYSDRFDHDLEIGRGRVSKLLSLFPDCGSVVDVGCSNGALVSAALEANLDAFGCDINGEILDAASGHDRKLTDRLFVCDIESHLPVNDHHLPATDAGKRRAIIMNDVVEHLLDPITAIRNAARMLGGRPGILVLDTPDTDSEGFMTRRAEWHHVRPVEHPVLYNETNLRRVLRKALPNAIVRSVDRPIHGKMVLYVEVPRRPIDGPSENPLTVWVPAGIGDFSWVYSKLSPLGRKLDVKCFDSSDTGRGRDFARWNLPLVNTFEYVKDATYEEIVKRTSDNMPWYESLSFEDWQGLDEPVYFGLNGELEAGRRLENIIPVLGCDFNYEIPAATEIRDEMEGLNANRVILHTQSVRSCQFWGAWMPSDWIELARLISEKNPDVEFTVLGAKQDEDALMEIFNGVPLAKALIGEKFEYVLQEIAVSQYVVSFCSGIAIVANVMGVPSAMFYHKHLKDLWWSWASPQSIGDGTYVPMSHWTSPRGVFDIVEQFPPR